METSKHKPDLENTSDNTKANGSLEAPSKILFSYPRRQPRGPRPIVVKSDETVNRRSEPFLSGNVADAMTEDFARNMSGNAGYNDNLDMDQQSQEYWDNP